MPGTPTEQGPRNSPETAQPLGAVVGMLKGWVERCGWVWVSAQIIELRRRANYSMQFLTLRDTSLEVSAQATATNAVLDAAGPLTEGTTVLACLRPRVGPDGGDGAVGDEDVGGVLAVGADTGQEVGGHSWFPSSARRR